MAEVRLIAETRTEFGRVAPVAPAGPARSPRCCTATASTPAPVTARAGLRARHQGRREHGAHPGIAGRRQLALPKSVVRHPLRDYVEHVDLLVVRRGEKVTVDIQVIVTGEAASGTLVSPMRTRCPSRSRR